ncbi:unnamed protein product [Arctia plantaginis]|uniref:HTH psq-type domain-containing protein n=1 Tax=Arctia plantaginis TaxID=874455 RepID=A0A8S1BC08_ARCPL|nr:unnamed protein product [Arctia plantaginis]
MDLLPTTSFVIAVVFIENLSKRYPFKYKPPKNARKRKKYTKTKLENAICEIKEGASIRKTSIKYGIDRST